MTPSEIPCLSLAIDHLVNARENLYAIWVLKAPYPGGYVHHDCLWTESLSQTWQAWQGMFSLRVLPGVPHIAQAYPPPASVAPVNPSGESSGSISYTAGLMQRLGLSLWQWLFDGPIQGSLNQSQGIAIGQRKALRVRLEVRSPSLIALPWEIMQPQIGRQAIALRQDLLFSRTTSDVEPLPDLKIERTLKILLVLGADSEPEPDLLPDLYTPSFPPLGWQRSTLQLEQEAATLSHVLQSYNRPDPHSFSVTGLAPCQVDTLLQPTPAELIQRLETGTYNILFYSGHGMPAPDGGLLFLKSDLSMNGTELAQVLTRCRVTLAVFNACWGAQPDQSNYQAIPRSSLAEVLIHHGVPAVLAMRDSISDQEALTFIQAFAQALAERLPIDQAVAVARQQLLTIYRFNQPAWTLPVLYMHPEFNGQLLQPPEEGMTELPQPTLGGQHTPNAFIRQIHAPAQSWAIRCGFMRVGRRDENDLVVSEQWVSQRHAEIFCREHHLSALSAEEPQYTFYLRDFSRYGTLVSGSEGWQRVHHQEVPLEPGTQLKFGSSRGQIYEFWVEDLLGAEEKHVLDD
jgi:hypothetical protein